MIPRQRSVRLMANLLLVYFGKDEEIDVSQFVLTSYYLIYRSGALQAEQWAEQLAGLYRLDLSLPGARRLLKDFCDLLKRAAPSDWI